MNNITLKSIVFNNFMSYGNNVNEFTFPKGVVWMSADNGAGKSTLVEAINFGLFGKSYRGGNKSELRNTRNTEGTMRVIIEFDCEREPGVVETYRVTRSISPKGTNKFEVEKLDGDAWVTQSKRAGYSQADFEEGVLGFNEVLFKNDIAMNTQETVPFLEMEPKKQRELLESIIMVSMDPWKKETNRRLSNAMTAFDIAESDKNRINGEISNLEAICERLKQEKQENVALLQQQLDDAQAKLASATENAKEMLNRCVAKKGEVDGFAAQAAGETLVDRSIARIQAAGTEVSVLVRTREELTAKENELAKVTAEYSAMPAEETKARVAELTGSMYQESLDLKNLERQLAQENAQAASLEGRMNEITAQAKAMKPGVPCPTCGKPSTEEDIEKHKAEFRRQYVALRDEANKKKESAAAIQTKIDEINTNLESETAEKSSLDAKMGNIAAFYSEKVSPVQTAVSSLKASVARSEGIVKAAGIDPDGFAAELERLNAEKAKYPAIRAAWQKAYDEYNEVSGEFRTADAGKNACQAEVNRISAELEKAKRQAEGDSLAITEQKLESARNDLADADLRMHTASDDRIAYEYIGKNMCADDGIKKMIFSNFIPVFNESVDRNIKKLGLPFGLEFADDMSSTFRSSPGFAPSYDMLSQGQRRKLGFAVQMAIRDLVSLIGNFRINFLSMDEVLDISTDDEGMRDMMDIVRSMSDEIGCTLVITHRGSVVADKFDYRITVENDGNYSQLGELEKL